MEEGHDDIAVDKRRLVGRIAFALVVLVALLASLSVFDRLNAPPDPVPVAARPPSTAPREPSVAAVQPVQEQAPTAEAAKPVVAEESAVPKEPVVPQAAAKPLTVPAKGRHAALRPTELAVSPAPTPVPGGSGAPATRQAAPVPVVARPLPQGAAKPFALQVGVFGDVANAEELRARLEMAGIRASIEARVHVGPFASRAEADAARARLRELGFAEAVLFSMKAPR